MFVIRGMVECGGCGRTIEETRVMGKPILVVGKNTYVLWDSWHVIKNGVLIDLISSRTGVA